MKKFICGLLVDIYFKNFAVWSCQCSFGISWSCLLYFWYIAKWFIVPFNNWFCCRQSCIPAFFSWRTIYLWQRRSPCNICMAVMACNTANSIKSFEEFFINTFNHTYHVTRSCFFFFIVTFPYPFICFIVMHMAERTSYAKWGSHKMHHHVKVLRRHTF